MKSLDQIRDDNRITSRDFGGMCQWFVFHDGDLLACFVNERDARAFMRDYDIDGRLTISEAKP